MKKTPIVLLFSFILLVLIFYFSNKEISKIEDNSQTLSQTTTYNFDSPKQTTNTSITEEKTLKYSYPIQDFFSRITKKTFSQFVDPENSPVENEKFTGFHTGVDIEYTDRQNEEIPVYSISDGKVLSATTIDGYGGFLAIEHEDIISIYGHLSPQSLPKTDDIITKGQKVGFLGEGGTTETNGERKHLHFAIINGKTIDYRGYVETKDELNKWINPIQFLQTKKSE